MAMKKIIIVFGFCCSATALCKNIEIQGSIFNKGKFAGISDISIDSTDTLHDLITKLEQDLLKLGFPLNTTAQKKNGTLTIKKIQLNGFDIMAPGLQKKTIDTMLPKKKPKSLWDRLKELHEMSPECVMYASIELT